MYSVNPITFYTEESNSMSQFIPAKLTENAIVVLEKRYLRKDEEHNIIETPDEMFRRVAKAIAKVEMPHMSL